VINNWWIADYLQGNSRELIISVRYYHDIHLVGLRKTTNKLRMAGLRAEIWSRYLPNRSRGSSVSKVSDYGLDDRAIRVRSQAEAMNFSSNLCVHTGSGAHRAPYPMGTGGLLPGGKARLGRDADHSPPSSAEVKNELHSSPPRASMACSVTALLYILTEYRAGVLTTLPQRSFVPWS
jgi:hypothetical protein